MNKICAVLCQSIHLRYLSYSCLRVHDQLRRCCHLEFQLYLSTNLDCMSSTIEVIRYCDEAFELEAKYDPSAISNRN